MHERIYELLEVNPTTLGNREFRQVGKSDLDTIVSWIRAMQLEAMGIKMSEDDATLKKELLQNDLWKTFYILCQGDTV